MTTEAKEIKQAVIRLLISGSISMAEAERYYLASQYYHDMPTEIDVWATLIPMIERQMLKIKIQHEVIARETNRTNRRLLENQLRLECVYLDRLIDRREIQKERIK